MKLNTNKKMMVSLCGLALSSLFVLNNKSVVHADTVSDNNQNNAISWDSDSDAAQGVQNIQKADNDRQNVASVSQPRAETSTVRSSSAAPRTTNQNASVQSSRVANVQDAQKTNPVVINNPANNKVHVHYVDTNGNTVDNSSYDYDIDVTKTGQGSYTVPTDSKGNKYQLNYPDGKYTVSGGVFTGTDLKGNTWTVPGNPGRRVRHMGQWTDDNYDEDSANKTLPYVKNDRLYVYNKYISKYVPVYTKDDTDKITATYVDDGDIGNMSGFGIGDANKWRLLIRNKDEASESAIDDTTNLVWVYNDPAGHFEPSSIHKAPDTYETIGATSGYTNQTLPVAFVDSNNNIVGMIQNYSGKVGTTQNVNLTLPTGYKLADGATLPTSVTFQNSTNPLLVKVVPNGKMQSVTNPANNTINVKFVDQTTGQQVETDTIDLTKAQNGTNYYNVPKGYGADNGMYNTSVSVSTEYTGLSALNIQGPSMEIKLNVSNDTIKSLYDYFGQDADIHMSLSDPSDDASNDKPRTVYLSNPDGVLGHGYLTLSDSGSVPNWERELYRVVVADTADLYSLGWTLLPDTKQVVSSRTFTDNYHTISNGTVTVPVHKTNSFTFSDNSGNVKSVSGNTVDVTLTNPQSVNPAMDKRCQSQATRTIQINFPDGQVPKSYDGIVDKSGKLVQTVHFTRTATEDALTGNILQYGNWTSDNQDHNFIGFEARTLPRIPGYTLKISPVLA